MDFIFSFFKKYRVAIPVSVLWGFCLLLGIINQWPYFWRRSFPVQFFLSAFITAAGAGLFFLLLKNISWLYINRTNKEKLYLILCSLIISLLFTAVLFRKIPISQYPFFSHTLKISATGEKNPASNSSEVKLLELQINGKKIHFKSLEQSGEWLMEEGMMRSRGQATLTYVFKAGLDPNVEILFESGPSAGLGQIEFDRQKPIVKDFYSDYVSDTLFSLPPFALKIKHSLFLFMMLIFAGCFAVIFWLVFCIHIIIYIRFRRYIIDWLQSFSVDLPKYAFQFPGVGNKLMYENHEIARSLAARWLVFIVPLCYLLFYLFQGKFLLLGNTDHVDAQLPYLFAARFALSAGQLPWWNPFIFNGAPLWGNPAIFMWYPPTWIELITPNSIVLYVSTFISWSHYCGVFVAAFLYFRALIGDEKWAVFSALAYGFSISVAYGLSVGNAHLPVYVFLPLSLYLLHTHEQRSFRRNLIYLTLSLYFMITGGFLQFLVYAMVVLGSYALFLAYHAYRSNSREPSFSLILTFILSLFVALLLSAPAWISILTMAGFVSRVSATDASLQVFFNSEMITPINRLLRLFMPNGFGFDFQYPYSYVETAVCFSGVSTLYLGCLSVVHKPNRMVIFWAGFCFTVFLLCFTPLVFLQTLVFGGVGVMTGRLLFILPLGVAALAGLGGKSLLEQPVSHLRLFLLNPFFILAGMAAFSNIKLIWQYFLDSILKIRSYIELGSFSLHRSDMPAIELLRALVILMIFALVFDFGSRKIINKFWIFFVILLLFEVVPSAFLMHKIQLNPLMVSPPKPFFAFDGVDVPLPFSPSELEMSRLVITEQNPSRRANDAPPYAKESNQGSIYGYQSPWGYANGYSADLATLISTVGPLDLRMDCESHGLINGVSDILHNASRQVIFDPLCYPRLSDLMSVGVVMKAGKEWEIVEDRRDTALPRISLFYKYESETNTPGAASRLAEKSFDIHSILIVEQKNPLNVGPFDPDAEVIFVKDAPNEVVVRTQSATPALLLLTDTYYPGWIATVDEKPVEILKANGAFRSVWVPAGEHRVEFRFEPPWLRFSLALAFLGIITLGVVIRMSQRLGGRQLWACCRELGLNN